MIDHADDLHFGLVGGCGHGRRCAPAPTAAPSPAVVGERGLAGIVASAPQTVRLSTAVSARGIGWVAVQGAIIIVTVVVVVAVDAGIITGVVAVGFAA